jgi:hypothetical protein
LLLGVFALKPISVRHVAASPLPAVIARGKAGFPAEELCEMAGIGAAHVKGNGVAIGLKACFVKKA